ncbi:MAG: AarF/ABC1/UbiB kinase family protein [Proteobacteria bacterium]|nr:AarF/ABC1/UbiB kinase family protein [Pseudomonadota bacterium]
MVSIRKIGVIGRTYRNFNRYRQILTIIFKYGFGDLVNRLKIDQYLEIGLQMISQHKRDNVEKLSRAERIRLLFEELGPTFIKFAQILSTRPDIIPADVIREFEKLQDDVPPFSFDEARHIIEHELGDRVESLFESIDEIPLASASIGQVHKAVLKDGDVVAVKIQRPRIRKIIEVDLEIMLHIATLMENHIEELSFQKPVHVIEEFARTLERELDYGIEASSMERMAAQFLRDRTVYIPKLYPDYSKNRVLTMEYVRGIKVSDVKLLEAEGLNRKIITARGADFIMKQVFEFGFFHADPHPGNVFVLPGNVICPLDFGMTGFVDKRRRALFIDLLESVAKKDSERSARLLLDLGNYEEEPDIRLFEKEIDDFMGRHLFKSLKEIDLGRLLQDFLAIATRNKVSVPPVIFLMIKAFAALEGIARLLDPGFDMIAHAEPFVKRAKLSRYSPRKITEGMLTALSDSISVFQDLPREVLQVARNARQNKLTLNVEIKGLGNLLRTYDQVSNRVSFSIIIGSLIIGSALLLAFKTPPLVYGVSLVGMIGFSVAAVFGIWLLIAILKKGML